MPEPVVLTQGLGVHPGELGRHGDHVDRSLGRVLREVAQPLPGPTPAHVPASSMRLARGSVSPMASSKASRACLAALESFLGTAT